MRVISEIAISDSGGLLRSFSGSQGNAAPGRGNSDGGSRKPGADAGGPGRRCARDVKETRYVHTISIDADAGIYDVDCSGLVSWIFQQIASRHLQQIPVDASAGRPLARDYYRFFASRSAEAEQRWQQISGLADARKGDLVAWQLPPAPHGDTGHLFVVRATPVPNPDGTLRIHVIDASDVRHFDDSRGTGPGQFCDRCGFGIHPFPA